jgi:hypothetical protein
MESLWLNFRIGIRLANLVECRLLKDKISPLVNGTGGVLATIERSYRRGFYTFYKTFEENLSFILNI